MKILITGSRGSIGTNLVPFLKEKKHNVIEITSDIRDYTSLRKEMLQHKSVDWVVHLAAIVNTITCDLAGRHAYEVNVTGTHNVAELTKEVRAKYCYFSTTAIYQPGVEPILEDSTKDPATLYGFTKYLGELTSEFLYKNDKDKLLILRPCFAFGGINDHSIGSRIINSGLYNEPLNIQLDPEKKKDYMHVRNLSEAIENLLVNNIVGDYNISYGKPTHFKELVKKVEDMGLKPIIYFRPELDYMGNHVVDNKKIKSVIDWEPTITLDEGLAKVYKNLKKQKIKWTKNKKTK